LSVRATNFDKYDGKKGKVDNVTKIDFEPIYSGLNKENLTEFVKQEIAVSDKPELTSARIVLA